MLTQPTRHLFQQESHLTTSFAWMTVTSEQHQKLRRCHSDPQGPHSNRTTCEWPTRTRMAWAARSNVWGEYAHWPDTSGTKKQGEKDVFSLRRRSLCLYIDRCSFVYSWFRTQISHCVCPLSRVVRQMMLLFQQNCLWRAMLYVVCVCLDDYFIVSHSITP